MHLSAMRRSFVMHCIRIYINQCPRARWPEICMTRMELTDCTKRLARWMRQEYVEDKARNFPACRVYDCRAVWCDACDGAVELSGAPVSGTADQCIVWAMRILKPSAYAPHVSSILAEIDRPLFCDAMLRL